MSKIKFFITPVYPYGNDHYYHEVIALAEGFRELGHDVFSNANYWFQPETNTYLLNEDSREDHEIAIYDYRYVSSFSHLLFRKGYPGLKPQVVKVLVDRNDWISPVWLNDHYRVFDIILSGNLFQGVSYPSNIKPWAIGLTNRIITTTDRYLDENEKSEPVIGHNFRLLHNMREYVLKGLEKNPGPYPLQACFTQPPANGEADMHYWKLSTGRHMPEYFKMLNSKLMFAGFGGYYEYKPLAYTPYSFWDKIRRKLNYWYAGYLERLGKSIAPAVFVFQYDNFRYWEVLYSRSCPVNLNVESWNFKMPVNPVDGEHYLGINKFDFKDFSKRLSDTPSENIRSIGAAGRKWVLKHYSPRAQAQRLLGHIEELKR